MNASEHMIGGAIATSLTYLLVSSAAGEAPTMEGLLTAALVGVPTGLLLDLVEPAIHPHHRGPAHSVLAFGGLVAVANGLWSDGTVTQTNKVWGLVALAGIGSHHVLDSSTPRGLPLTGIRL
jgi:inner membrane protein